MKFSVNVRKSFVEIASVCFFFVLFFKDIRYTDDLSSYQLDYDLLIAYDFINYAEIVFSLIKIFFVSIKCDFQDFYNTVLFVNLLLWAKVFRLYSVNSFIGLTFLLLMLYVQFANQIAFFMGLPIMLISYSLFYIYKKRIYGIVLSIISVGIHPGLIGYLLYFFISRYINFYSRNKYSIIKKSIIIGLIGFFSVGVGAHIIVSFVPYFGTYIEGEGASMQGMIFVLIFPIVCLSFLWNKTPHYLYKTSILSLCTGLVSFTLIWMFVSLCGLQIINARYVNAMCCMWLCYLCVLFRAINVNHFNRLILSFFIIAFLSRYLGDLINLGSIKDDGTIYKIFLIWTSRFQ